MPANFPIDLFVKDGRQMLCIYILFNTCLDNNQNISCAPWLLFAVEKIIAKFFACFSE
jgi:hypothetical protein